MREDISLYIAGQKCDLDNSSLILLNWTAEELGNPTIVKNSYSQQVSLPGTDTNNKIFGGAFRLDRRQVYSSSDNKGAYFNPTRKTDFAIYDSMNNLLESGYVKLDAIEQQGNTITYDITLFGGLGSFFYGLSYDDNGNKLSLASLDFGEDLTFEINATAVQQAWQRLTSTGEVTKWDIINFAPAYNGLPDDFNADKVVVIPSIVGLDTEVVDGDSTYTPKNSYSIIKLNDKVTEWEVQDLRSYLQRMVIKLSKVIEAICNPANNGGWNVSLDATFFNANNPYWDKAWITLPQLNKLPQMGSLKQRRAILVTPTFESLSDSLINIPLGIEEGTDMALTLKWQLQASATYALERAYLSSVVNDRKYQYIIFAQLLAYSNDTIVAGSEVKILQSALSGATTYTPAQAAALCEYTPTYTTEYSDDLGASYFEIIDGVAYSPTTTLELQGANITAVKLHLTSYLIVNGISQGEMAADVYETQSALEPVNALFGVGSVNGSEYTYTATEIVRSNTTITQTALLSNDTTPADYLISYCKLFGLGFVVNKDDKSLSIVTRNNLFANTDIIDITDRVDLSKDINIQPFAFDSKWYTLGYDYSNGEYAKEYADTNSLVFGEQKINTGYAFNAETKKLLENLAYKGGVELLGRSKYYANVMQGGKYRPTPVIGGASYTLWNSEGDSKSIDITTPNNAATITYFNPSYPIYDAYPKLQLHNEDNKSFDGSNVLVFYQGYGQMANLYPNLRVTDDSAIMNTLNDNNPCWFFGAGGYNPDYIPLFGRYMWSGNTIVQSWDFGTPLEIDIPSVIHSESVTLYPKFWENYIQDKYDDDTKVLTCWVDLTGIVVDNTLLRRFFYYRNALWMLNKVVNHNVGTFDRTQCEFIKVQDLENYTNGQNI